jgi:hypothetical protein
MPPLTEPMKKIFLERYLGHLRKVLEEDVLTHIIVSKQTSNPLFLRMTIDELVAVAVHETVLSIAKHCCSLQGPMELCGMLLERYEEEFGRSLVQRSFALIASSRYGIAEDELMQARPPAPAPASSRSPSPAPASSRSPSPSSLTPAAAQPPPHPTRSQSPLGAAARRAA